MLSFRSMGFLNLTDYIYMINYRKIVNETQLLAYIMLQKFTENHMGRK